MGVLTTQLVKNEKKDYEMVYAITMLGAPSGVDLAVAFKHPRNKKIGPVVLQKGESSRVIYVAANITHAVYRLP